MRTSAMETEPIIEKAQLNQTITTIYSRRAVRKYKAQPVERRLIDQLLAAGRMAPSAMNRQPWRFYVVTNKELHQLLSKDIVKKAFKEEISKGIKGILNTAFMLLRTLPKFDLSKFDDPVFYNAPVVIFITAPTDNEWAGLDIGMCTQNIMLAAKSMGLDTCPVGFGKFVDHTAHYARLGIPENEKVQLAVIAGYGDEEPPVHKRITDNVSYFD